MKLSKTTQCSLFQIQVPRWKERVVGLADYRLSTHNEIHILAKDKEGKRYYPDNYYISQEKARSYPLQTRSGIDLRLVPINDLETLERI